MKKFKIFLISFSLISCFNLSFAIEKNPTNLNEKNEENVLNQENNLNQENILENENFKKFENFLEEKNFLKNGSLKILKNPETLEIENLSLKMFKEEILRKINRYKTTNKKTNPENILHLTVFLNNMIKKNNYNDNSNGFSCFNLKLEFSGTNENNLILNLVQIKKNEELNKKIIEHFKKQKINKQEENNLFEFKKQQPEKKELNPKKLNMLKEDAYLKFLKELENFQFITFNSKKEPQVKFLENGDIKTSAFNEFFYKTMLEKLKNAIENNKKVIIIENIIDQYWKVYNLKVPIVYDKFSNEYELEEISKENKFILPLNNFNLPYKNFEGLKSNIDYITYSGKIYDICHDSQTFTKKNGVIEPFKELQFSKKEIENLKARFKLFEKPNRLKEILEIAKKISNDSINSDLDFSSKGLIDKRYNIPFKDLNFIIKLVTNDYFEKLNSFKNLFNSNQPIKPVIFNITVFNLKKDEVDFFNFEPRIIIPAVKFSNEIKEEIKNVFKNLPNDKIKSIINLLERQAAKKIKELNLQPAKENEEKNLKPVKIELPLKNSGEISILEVEVYFKHNGIFFGNYTLKKQ